MPAERYYILKDGGRLGPLSLDELSTLWKVNDELNPDTAYEVETDEGGQIKLSKGLLGDIRTKLRPVLQKAATAPAAPVSSNLPGTKGFKPTTILKDTVRPSFSNTPPAKKEEEEDLTFVFGSESTGKLSKGKKSSSKNQGRILLMVVLAAIIGYVLFDVIGSKRLAGNYNPEYVSVKSARAAIENSLNDLILVRETLNIKTETAEAWDTNIIPTFKITDRFLWTDVVLKQAGKEWTGSLTYYSDIEARINLDGIPASLDLRSKDGWKTFSYYGVAYSNNAVAGVVTAATPSKTATPAKE